MRYTRISGTDLQPSVICLGTGGLGSSLDRDSSFALLDAYAAHGGNFLDSAKIYADWLPIERSASEKTIGRWMVARGNRDRIIVATKGAHPDLATMHIARMSPRELAFDIDASLQHLQTSHIDLYWLHRDDIQRPVGEIIETLNLHIQAGKIRYFGCSNWSAARIQAAQEYAVAHNMQGFSADQPMWSAAMIDMAAMPDKTLVAMNEELFSFHTRTGMAAIPYSSQANGLFTKMANGTVLSAAAPWYRSEENNQRLLRIKKLSAETGLTVTQVVLAYLMAQPFTTIPIVGCRNQEQLLDSLSASDAVITNQQVRYIESGSIVLG